MNKNIIQSTEDMVAAGEGFAQKLEGGSVVFLYGNLGVGKTYFTKGIAKGLGIKTTIKSPSYTFVWPHSLPDEKVTFYHFDLYRLEKGDDIEALSLREVWGKPDSIVVVEWADRLVEDLPQPRTEIYIEYLDENKREMRIEEVE